MLCACSYGTLFLHFSLKEVIFVDFVKPCINLYKATGFFQRLRGLIGKRSLPEGYGLLIAPCNSIHMLFMRFPIDAIFIDKDFRIKKIVANLPTWFGFAFCLEAWAVIEMNAGEASRLNLDVGQLLAVEWI